MQPHTAYRKFVTVTNGKKVVTRFLSEPDRDGLLSFFQQAPKEDIQFCKEDVKDPRVAEYWLTQKNLNRMLVLVAEDSATGKIVASLNVLKGQQAALHVGEIQQILVARAFQGVGLGSLLLDELMDLAGQENLKWLKVEVVTDLKNVIRAFLSRGFEIKAILYDYFVDLKGITYDTALMLRRLTKGEENF